MSFKTLSQWFTYLLVAILVFQNSLFAQTGQMSDEQLTEELKAYVNELLTRYGEQNIEKERYLVQQIRMINEEIKSRVGNVAEKRTQYFDKLQSRLGEIKALKDRLTTSGGQLNTFIDELEFQIERTIDTGVMDYKRQKVIDDATQLLYLAEELIKLDPATNLNQNPQILAGISNTNQKIVSTFGGESTTSGIRSGSSNVTIFDVYQEWQRTERIKYHVRLTDIQVIKNRLVKNSTASDLQRMFNREMRHAAESYNFGYYELAELSFEEILEKYRQIGNLDDALFYRAECNYLLGRFNKAEKQYEKIIREFPSSSFIPITYNRLISITSHFEKYGNAVNHFRQMQNIVSSTDSYFEQSMLLALNAALNGGFYEDAVSLSYEVRPQSPYYNYARYIQGKALVGAQNLEEANTVFKELLNTSNLDPEFRFDILAKIGFIHFELGQPETAITYFNQIGGSYSNYDRVLMGYSWSYYKIELGKLSSQQDFTQAKQYIKLVMDNYPNSEYNLETYTLLGYINQLEINTTGAINNFRYAYNAKDIKILSDNLNDQQNQLEDVVSEANKLEREALEKRNLEAFNRAVDMRKKVEKPLFKLKYSDLSPVGMAATNEVKRLGGQLDELDRLKQIAIEKNDAHLVDRIEDMQLKIYNAINSHPVQETSVLGYNYFDEHPLARKESIVEDENEKLLTMRNQSAKERQEVSMKIARLDVEIQNARTRQDYKKLASLEISRDRFVDLLGKLDYVDTWVYSMKMHETNINLDRWSDYGAFGLANVNFAVRNLQKEQIGQMRTQIQKINDLLQERKENIEHKIRQIQNEITLMTRRVRRQERIREREELNRQFEESYFDTHETETENPNQNINTLPPKFDDESEN